MSELLEIGERVLEKAGGSDQIELYMVSDRNIEVVIQRGEITQSSSHMKELVGIRVLHNDRLGFSSVNSFDEPIILEKVKEARRLAKSTVPDENNVIPSPENVSYLEGLYDKKVSDFSVDDALRYAKRLLDTAIDIDLRFRFSDGSFSSHDLERGVVNSFGIGECEKSSVFSYMGMGMAVEGGEITNFDVKADGSRDVQGIDVERVAQDLVESTVSTLGARKGQSFQGTGILSPYCLGTMIFMGMILPLKGNRVLKGISPFAGKLGERVASFDFTLSDDPGLKGELGSRSFDREGLPTPKMTLVNKGVLQSYLHNSYTAKAFNVQPTGHASGGPRTVPGIDPSNLRLSPGDISLESMLEQVDRGVLINRFSGEINPVSGDFSGVVKGAKIIEDGEIKHPLKNMMVSGNVFRMFKNISEVSSETKKITYLCMELPSVRAEELSFISG
ncbi:MAG: TldD/PmbA family protein [Thermoplasmata archaeon]